MLNTETVILFGVIINKDIKSCITVTDEGCIFILFRLQIYKLMKSDIWNVIITIVKYKMALGILSEK